VDTACFSRQRKRRSEVVFTRAQCILQACRCEDSSTAFYPTAEQETLLRRTIGCCRLVYNRALHERSEAWTSGKKSIGYAAQSAALTGWKKEPELAFLNDVSSVPIQQSLRHLQTSYANFFAKRAKYPSFKSKRSGGSAEFTRSGFRFAEGKLTLAKMDAPLDIRWSRPLPEGAQPSSASVSLDASQRWHVSLLCEDRAVKHLPKLKTVVGIDLGINALATLSTGEKIPNLRTTPRDEAQAAPLPSARPQTERIQEQKQGSNQARSSPRQGCRPSPRLHRTNFPLDSFAKTK
jgi:putative transposase